MNADVIEPSPPPIRVDRRIVDRLAARGVISPAARAFALDRIEPPRRWGVWVARLITVVGAALVLAGLVYFFAFNWNRIPPLVKLGAIAALFATAVATVAIVGFGRTITDVAASAAVLLVGVFLAVDGQIHQTGADAWQLFAGWAILALPFALPTNAAAAWAVWIAVADVAVIAWWDQTRPAGTAHDSLRHLMLLGLDGGFLLVREVLASRGAAWVAPRWTRFLLLLPVVATATATLLALLDRPRDATGVDAAVAVVAIVVFAALFATYRRLVPDVTALAAVTVAATVVIDFALFQLLTGDGRNHDLGIFFVMGLLTLALFAAAVAWLRGVARSMEA